MSNDNWYWHGGMVGTGSSSSIPSQTLSNRKKNTDYLKRTVDSLESIGRRQIAENLRFRDFYRMIEGKLSYTEIDKSAPQLQDIKEKLEDFELYNEVEHFDIIGVAINALVGEYMAHEDKFYVTNTDTIATSEYLRERNDLANKYIRERFQKSLQIRLLNKGLEISKQQEDFDSQEEFQSYIREIQAQVEALTPPQIEKYLNSSWQSKGVLWGQATLEKDRERFNFRGIYKDLLIDYFGTGRAFLHYLVSEDYYKPERWSPIITFFSQEVDNKYPQYGEYIGRINKFTRAEIFKRWGTKISKIDKEKLNNSHGGFQESFSFPHASYVGDHLLHATEGKEDVFITPHKNYFDYNYMLALQDEFGIPVAEKTTLNANNEEVTYPVFLPQYAVQDYTNYGLGEVVSDNFSIRKDLLEVMEVYFTSYEEIGYLRYRTDSGLLISEIVTKDINKDFLRDYGIKNISALSLTDALHKYKGENIIIWDYVPRTYKCVKISNKGTQLSEPLYIDLGENDFQIKGNSNIFDIRHPVAGIVTKCVADKMLPHQTNHNIMMNQIKSLLQKELGLFWLFDVKMLPSDLKAWGDTEETLINIREVIKETGLFPIDLSRQNLAGGGQFNQFAPQNMTVSSQIADRMQLAERYKWMAYEQLGFTPQRLGAPVKYETAEGIRVGQQASFAQTEDLFETFTSFKKEALDMHLSVAQYAQSNNKDFAIYYTLDDGSRAFLELSDENLPLRMLNIITTSSPKKRRELEIFKQQIYSNNTLGTDLIAMAEFAQSDSTQEALAVAKSAYDRQVEEIRQRQQAQQQAAQIEAQKELEKEQMKLEYQEASKVEDRKNKVLVASINAEGRAADKHTDEQGSKNISDTTKMALDLTYRKELVELKRQSNELKQLDNEHKNNREDKRIELQERQLDLKEKELETKKYTSEINKN